MRWQQQGLKASILESRKHQYFIQITAFKLPAHLGKELQEYTEMKIIKHRETNVILQKGTSRWWYSIFEVYAAHLELQRRLWETAVLRCVLSMTSQMLTSPPLCSPRPDWTFLRNIPTGWQQYPSEYSVTLLPHCNQSHHLLTGGKVSASHYCPWAQDSFLQTGPRGWVVTEATWEVGAMIPPPQRKSSRKRRWRRSVSHPRPPSFHSSQTAR